MKLHAEHLRLQVAAVFGIRLDVIGGVAGMIQWITAIESVEGFKGW